MGTAAQIYAVQSQLEAITTDIQRKSISTNTIHFVPINIEALKLALEDKLVFTEEDGRTLEEVVAEVQEKYKRASTKDIAKEVAKAKKNFGVRGNSLVDFNDLRKRLANFIVSKHEYKIIQQGGIFRDQTGKQLLGNDLLANVPAVVYENSISPDNIIGAIYKSYDTTRQNLFQNFLNTEINKFLDKKIYEGTGFSEGFDVGHILGNSKLAQTPLALRLQGVIDKIDSVFNTRSVGEQQKLTQLRAGVQETLSILRAQSGYGPKIEATLSQDTRSALLSVNAILVIIQERKENQYFYGSLIEGALGRQLAELIAKLGFSKNIVEVAANRIHEILKHGKIKSRGKITKQVISTKQQRKTPVKVSTSSSSKITKVPAKQLPRITMVLDDTISLQRLLDTSLVQQVKQNMGTGNRRDILNLRSGRFAESVRTTNISEARSGAISVFYTYMKNPYATFSQGGKQQYPRTRDPKLLISKSIRELAQQQMITKLRVIQS